MESDRVNPAQHEGGTELESKLLAVLNHHRHSWLNDLQLIFGYIKLKKYDQLEAYVEKIRQKLECESRISAIPDPALVLELLQFVYNNQAFKLNVQIENGMQGLLARVKPPQLNDELVHMLNTFAAMALHSDDITNELTLQIQAMDDDVVALIFDYRGHYDQDELTRLSDTERRTMDAIQTIWQAERAHIKAIVSIIPAR